MSTFFHILKFKLLSFVKTTFDPRLVTAVRGLGSLVVFGTFAMLAYALSLGVTSYLLERTRISLFAYHRIISMMLFVLFVAVNMGNIIVSYATLYKSAEVGYLFTKPVSFVQIFVLKFLDNFLYSSTTFFLMVTMALFGYGSYFHYAWHTYVVLLVLVFLPFLFLSALFGVLILMSLMRIAAKWGFRKVMSALALVYAAILIVFFTFSSPMTVLEKIGQANLEPADYFRGFEGSIVSSMPNNIVSNVLFYVSRGEAGSATMQICILLALTAAVFSAVVQVGRRYYYKSWLVTFEFQARSNTVEAGRRTKLFDFRKNSHLSPQMESLLKREYFQFIRDSSQWIQLVLMFVLVGVFALSVRELNPRLRVTDIHTITYLILYAFAGFLSCSLALRFVFPAISLEGRSFWTQLSAPLSPVRVFLTKFGLGFMLVLPPAVLVAVFSNAPFVRLSNRSLLMYFGLFSTFWVSLTLVALNLGLGGYFANYQEKNPIRVASSQGATLTFLVSIVYLISLVSIIIIPLREYFMSIFQFVPFDLGGIVAPGTTLGVLSAALSAFGIVVGLRALQRDF